MEELAVGQPIWFTKMAGEIMPLGEVYVCASLSLLPITWNNVGNDKMGKNDKINAMGFF